MKEIIYAATPIRMTDRTDEICDFIEKQGYFPMHPFLALRGDCQRKLFHIF